MTNAALGLVVWSGEFSDWDEVDAPIGASPYQNPSVLLEFERFCHDMVAEYNDRQIAIIRRNCPKHFITHNAIGFPNRTDFRKLAANLDFISYDYYPWTKGDAAFGLQQDITRGIKRKSFWIMELLSGSPGCWFPMWPMPRPGMIRLFAWQSVAKGAAGVVQFRWRSAAVGAEQYWHGLIDHDNQDNRRLAEFAHYAAEMKRLAPLLEKTSVVNDCAVFYDAEQYAALQIQTQSDEFDYFKIVAEFHTALSKKGVGADVISERDDLDGYKAVFAPCLYILNNNTAEKLRKFVENGGTLVLTARSGVKDENNVCRAERLPARLTDVIGAYVEEYDPIGKGTVTVKANGETYKAGGWCDILATTSGNMFAEYAEVDEPCYYAGKTAATVNSFGKGKAYYIGTAAEQALIDILTEDALKNADIKAEIAPPEGVEICVRQGGGVKLVFVLNLTEKVKTVPLPKTLEGKRLALSGGICGKTLELPPYGAEIIA